MFILYVRFFFRLTGRDSARRTQVEIGYKNALQVKLKKLCK